jgi:hypothetical protein
VAAVKALAVLMAVFALLGGTALAASGDEGSGTIVYGDGWAFVVNVPAGWEFDCCKLATRHDSQLLVFPHGWNGADPDRVMLLHVWHSVRPTVDADWDADAQAYRQRFPDVHVEDFAATKKSLHCRSTVYTGSDHVRDYVVFCDPGNNLDFRFSWSMMLRDTDVDVAAAEAALRSVVAATLPMSASIQKR